MNSGLEAKAGSEETEVEAVEEPLLEEAELEMTEELAAAEDSEAEELVEAELEAFKGEELFEPLEDERAGFCEEFEEEETERLHEAKGKSKPSKKIFACEIMSVLSHKIKSSS